MWLLTFCFLICKMRQMKTVITAIITTIVMMILPPTSETFLRHSVGESHNEWDADHHETHGNRRGNRQLQHRLTHSVMGEWSPGYCESREKRTPRNNQGRLPGGGDTPICGWEFGKYLRDRKTKFCLSPLLTLMVPGSGQDQRVYWMGIAGLLKISLHCRDGLSPLISGMVFWDLGFKRNMRVRSLSGRNKGRSVGEV